MAQYKTLIFKISLLFITTNCNVKCKGINQMNSSETFGEGYHPDDSKGNDYRVAEGMTPFSYVLKALVQCTMLRFDNLYDGLSKVYTCIRARWQNCLIAHIHQLGSVQIELESYFLCHVGWFDVSHLKSLYYRVHALPHFQVNISE